MMPTRITNSPFVYFTGNLAHTKGKGINTMRSPRTPTRTITFAKVLTALSALLLYYLLHQVLPLKFVQSIFSLLTPTKKTLLNYGSPSLASTVFFISTVFFFLPNCNYSFFCSFCPPLSVSAFLWLKMGVLNLYSSFSFSEVITMFPYSLCQVVFYQCRYPHSL